MIARRTAPATALALALTLLGAQAASADYTQKWENRLKGYTRGVAVDANGNSYIGITNKAGSKTLVESYDADGKRRWRKSTGKTQVYDVAVTDDGDSVIAAGTGAGDTELWLIALNGDKGKLAASLEIEGIGLDMFVNLSLSLDVASETFYVGGTGFQADVFRGFVARFDGMGNLLWTRFVGDGQEEQFVHDVAADPKGNGVYFAGAIGNFESPTASDAVTGKFDADGDLDWQKTYNGPNNPFDRAESIVVHRNGKKIYVAGSSGSDESGGAVLLLHFTNKGKQKFARRVSTDWFRSMGKGLALADDGKSLHVVGQVCGEGFGICEGLMLMTNNKGKKPAWTSVSMSTTDDTAYESIGTDTSDGSYRIFGGTLDAKVALGSYDE